MGELLSLLLFFFVFLWAILIYNKTFNSFSYNKDLVNYLKSKLDLPTAEDYEGSIEAIHRLEDTYQINPKDMSDGNISEKYPLTRPLTG